jgi:hypothetical protein
MQTNHAPAISEDNYPPLACIEIGDSYPQSYIDNTLTSKEMDEIYLYQTASDLGYRALKIFQASRRFGFLPLPIPVSTIEALKEVHRTVQSLRERTKAHEHPSFKKNISALAGILAIEIVRAELGTLPNPARVNALQERFRLKHENLPYFVRSQYDRGLYGKIGSRTHACGFENILVNLCMGPHCREDLEKQAMNKKRALRILNDPTSTPRALVVISV